MLSIVVPTYGHEKYMIQALESIRRQKTKYKYEVLVGTRMRHLIIQENC